MLVTHCRECEPFFTFTTNMFIMARLAHSNRLTINLVINVVMSVWN